MPTQTARSTMQQTKPKTPIVSRSLTAAKQFGARIKDRKQGLAILDASQKTLGKAYDFTKGFRPADFASGAMLAEWNAIDQQHQRIKTLQARKEFSRAWADAVGLTVVQSADLLGRMKAATKDRNNQSKLEEFGNELAAMIKRILETAAKTVSKAMPSFGWLIIGYLAFKEIGKKRRV